MSIAVFIDGSNLYSKLKELEIQNTSLFDYFGLIDFLTRRNRPSFIGYYAGQIRKEDNNPKSAELYANQQKFLAHLQTNIKNVQISLGHIQNYNGIYKEKGVDVRIALDLYKFANEGQYEKAILISSDTDLLPAIRMAQALGKMVEYIGFSHNPSLALIKECHLKQLISRSDLLRFQFAQPI